MRIYLDNCCYNRPFDDQTMFKIYLETQAKLHIQEKIREGTYELVWSYILDYENGRNPYEEKRNAIAPWKNLAQYCVSKEEEGILLFAEELKKKGIKTFDALHIACAFEAECDYYITTDRKLLHLPIEEIKIADPIAFVREVEGE